MNSKTQELTYGAMLAAVFGVLLVLNRQTGGLFEEFVFFILPIPMAVFSLKYGWKDSIPVLVCMILISVFLGTFYTIFYACGEALIGLILGTCLKNHRDLQETQLLVIILSAVFSVIGSVVLASLFGININAEVTQIQSSMQKMLASSGIPEESMGNLFSFASMKRLYIISMVLFGVMQGFVIFRLSLLILRRLRLPVPDPRTVGLHRPPVWTGYAALILLLLNILSAARPFPGELLQNAVQTAGICSLVFLLWYGWLGLVIILRRLLPVPKIVIVLIALLCFFILPYLVVMTGFIFISTDLLLTRLPH